MVSVWWNKLVGSEVEPVQGQGAACPRDLAFGGPEAEIIP